ncbi:MAG TPA: phosphonate ABC transporter substrate-binding protein [Candidatus Tectomicrobia bacterium]|jgi:phosphonate transport system substrate-binding protein
MTWTKRLWLAALGGLLGVGLWSQSPATAADWRKRYPAITPGVITAENEVDRMTRYQPVRDYLQRILGVEIKWRTATDYAGIIEGVKAQKIELARFGPASYAQCWIVTKGAVEPLVGEVDEHNTFGYHAVILVKADSPYQRLDDLKGKKFAFADPNSTSGHQAPRYFLAEQGYDVNTFFGQTAFSGSHENRVMALLNGTFDAVATWWNSDAYSNPKRMEMKGMIPPGQWRIIWQSPRLPSRPWAMSTALPEQMRTDITAALLRMPQDGPEAWEALSMGQMKGFRRVTHADYEPIVRMIQHNLEKRRTN